jgi:hypothetical protein
MEEFFKNPKIEVNTNNVAKLLKEQLRDGHSICIVPHLSPTPYASKRKKKRKK